MVVINKPHVAAFGVAVFAQAVLALDFNTQNIPSPLFDPAQNVGAVSNSFGFISGHYPWEIDQPGTLSQKEVWDIFLKAVACFFRQPYEGGVSPPAIGPRNRSDWYDEDPGIPPIYYNYFMKETLLKLFADEMPDWCKAHLLGDTEVRNLSPDTNYSATTLNEVYLNKTVPSFLIMRSYHKVDFLGPYYLNLHVHVAWATVEPTRPLGVYEVDPEAFDIDTITWNNQPDLLKLIVTIPFNEMSDEWISIKIPYEQAFCIKFIDESEPEEISGIKLSTSSMEHATPARRPYTSV